MRRFLLLALAAGACAAGEQAARGQFEVTPPGLRWPSIHGEPIPLEFLLGSETIRKDLKLNEAQVEKITSLTQEGLRDYKGEYEALRKESRDLPSYAAVRSKLIESQREQMRKVLTAEQWRRVEQIDVQRMGRAAFADPAVRKALELTDEQAKAIDRVLKEAEADEEKQLQELAGPPGLAPADPYERLDALVRFRVKFTAEVFRKLEGELTGEQKKKWEALRGPAYTDTSRAGRFPIARPPDRPERLDAREVGRRLAGELKLSPDQRDRLDDISFKADLKFAEEWDKLREQSEELRERERKLDKRRRATLDPKLLDALTRPQKERLAQLRLQLLGLQAWEDPEVRKALGLTEDQRAAIDRILARVQERLPDQARDILLDSRREAAGDGNKQRKLMYDKAGVLYKEYADEILGQLTDAQKKQWEKLVGPPVPLEYLVDPGQFRPRR